MKRAARTPCVKVYEALLEHVPTTLRETLVWGNDWRQAALWLKDGTNGLPDHTTDMIHVEKAGTNRQRRWVTVCGDRYDERDRNELEAAARLAMLGQAERLTGARRANGKPYSIVIFRWIDERNGNKSTCYTLLHGLTKNQSTLGQTGEEPSPVDCKGLEENTPGLPGGRKLKLNTLAQKTLAWLSNAAIAADPPPDYRAPEPAGQDHTASRRTRKLRYPVWLHPSVSDELRNRPALYRRLGLILEQLAATARTSISKRCRAPNQGWLRTPLGGDKGQQLHLWWARPGSVPAETVGMASEAVLIGAVREQGDNHKLQTRNADDYLVLDTATDLDSDVAGEPWTAGQKAVLEKNETAVLIAGRPGSGKTTGLWHDIDSGRASNILYVTWSMALANEARAHFDSFAPNECEVDCTDFATLLGRINGDDVTRQTLGTSRKLFDETLDRSGFGISAEWQRYPGALYCEVRGNLIGQAQPGAETTVIEGGVARLTDKAYERRRSGSGGIGSSAARSVVKAIRAMDSKKLSAIFPELAAATSAHQRVQDADWENTSFDTIDKLVVDEAQDLTLLETGVITGLCRRIEKRRGVRPKLLVAGDSGQRVRPTGFQWNRVSALIAKELVAPSRTQMDEHVRCPEKISEIVNHAASFYSNVTKERRPTKQITTHESEHVEGHLLHVIARSTSEAAALVEKLGRTDGLAVMTPEADPPEWITKKAGHTVLTAADVKGLEYQTACVLESGCNILNRRKPKGSHGTSPLEEEQERTAIDRLRVCLSRSTETLILIDIAGGKNGLMEREATRSLLGQNAARYSPDDLIEYLAEQETDPEEQVERLVREADALSETAPLRAWERARQALALAGDPSLPNAVADPALRQRIRRTVLELTAVQMVENTDNETIDSGQLPGAAKEAAAIKVPLTTAEDITNAPNGSKADGQLIEIEIYILGRLPRIISSSMRTLTELLSALRALKSLLKPEDFWAGRALKRHAQRLRKRIADGALDPASAGEYEIGMVLDWLSMTGETKEDYATAEELAAQAARTLLDSIEASRNGIERQERLAQARKIAGGLTHRPYEHGRIAEAEGNATEAVKLYEKAGAGEDTLRALRKGANWRKASPLSSDAEKSDISWLLRLERLVEKRPANLEKRLFPAETERLQGISSTITAQRRGRNE